MPRYVKGWMLILYVLTAKPVLCADGQRFSDQAETTISVSVGNRELTARLLRGRTEIIETPGIHRTADAIAIYLPGSKLLWWELGHAPSDPNAQAIQEFKRIVRCVADHGAIFCFSVPTQGFVFVRRSGEQVEGSDI